MWLFGWNVQSVHFRSQSDKFFRCTRSRLAFEFSQDSMFLVGKQFVIPFNVAGIKKLPVSPHICIQVISSDSHAQQISIRKQKWKFVTIFPFHELIIKYMINLDNSKMVNPTAIDLFSVILPRAPLTVTKSGLIISLWRNQGLLTAFVNLFGSAMSVTFTLLRTFSIVLPNVALACKLARSDSKSELAIILCLVQRSIHGLSHVAWTKDKMRWILVTTRPCLT